MTTTVHIYTDGSYKEATNRLGIGAYCSFNGKEYLLAETLTKDILTYYDVTDEKVRNPTAEFICFAEVLKYLKPGHKYIFYVDYIGIKCWMEGSWKANKPYIKKIKSVCDSLIKNGLNVEIVHIKGHSSIYGNERADKLASDTCQKNTFKDF